MESLRKTDQVFNGIIREEIIKTYHHIKFQLLQNGYEFNLHYSIIINLMIQCIF